MPELQKISIYRYETNYLSPASRLLSEAGFTRFTRFIGLGPLGEANHLSTVVRGPVPRDLPTSAKNARNPDYGRLLLKPVHGEGQALALRAGDCLFLTVALPLFSRSARTLIKRQRDEPLHIKVLQTLGCLAVQAAIDIKILQT